MDPFEYNANPGRVVFGSGSIQKLPTELQRLSVASPLLISTPRRVDQTSVLAKILDNASIKPAGMYRKATMHTPSHITEEALALARESNADCVG